MGRKLATIILAAGQGTRMKSKRAKVLHELGGDPLVTYPVRLALSLKAKPIVLVIGHQAEAVRARAEAEFPEKVSYAVQAKQKGTGHAVMEGMKSLEGYVGRVLILYGDVPLLRRSTVARMIRQMDKQRLSVALITTKLEDPTGYGRIMRNRAGNVVRIVEEKDAISDEKQVKEINAGIYCVESELLTKALRELRSSNAQGEYYLTDIVTYAVKQGLTVGSLEVEDSNEVLGANTKKELAQLDAILRNLVMDRHMASGVSIVDPSSTFIGPRVKIGRDTVIEPGVHLRGTTVIGKECRIDVGAVITNARIGNEVTVHPYSVIEDALMRNTAAAGPFARLRPGAELMEKSRVGNFVEVKKTRIGKGAKANHLAYLGDAKIGDESNIGAGTITCNYDGIGKNETNIGAKVFIGSNATLVAPLRIRSGAYVAAGSTITEAVDKNDLAFGRARQINKPGRAAEVRQAARQRAVAKNGPPKS